MKWKFNSSSKNFSIPNRKGNIVCENGGLMIWDDPFTEDDEVVCRFIDLPLTKFFEGSEQIIDGSHGSFIK